MFPLWDVAIAPVLTAAKAQKVVEIGALRGENTVQILDHLGPEAELHVIDPVPAFDPEEHARQFPGQYFFYEALSVDVLPDMKAMDAALIDGDHNWWTVYNECSMIAASATREGVAMPVMILHDVLWPYGRRDLYYDPSNVPEERRQPFAYQGMKPGMKRLAKKGGLNPDMANALVEGGERNGVMTGLEDFIAEYPKPIRTVVLPFYFGLAIVAEEERLEREPELAAAFDHLESAEARFEMLETAEAVHLKSMLFQHNSIVRHGNELDRAADRYFTVVKQALLNEHYLENEARFEMLNEQAQGGALDAQALRDPSRHDQPRMNRLVRNRLGAAGPNKHHASSTIPFTAMGRSRLDHLHRCLDHVRDNGVAGDFVEVATGRGGGAMFMRAFLEGHEIADTKVWVADRFRVDADPATEIPARGVSGLAPDLNTVRDGFHRFGFLDDQVGFVQGPPAASLAASPIDEIALLRIGRTGAQQVTAVLDAVYDRLAPGAVVIIDEQAGDDVRPAVEEFHRSRAVVAPIERHDGATIAWVKSADDMSADAVAADAPSGRGIPVLRPLGSDTVDVSIVIVFYNMAREATRTLESFRRSYQEGVDDLTYEVIAVDNGSDPDQRLDRATVEANGPEFRLIDMGDDAHPSPVFAMNRGIAESRGEFVGMMIDGAHVVTPGVLRYAVMAMRNHAPAIAATQQWFVGPGQQSEAMQQGYDREYEDALFEKINWPATGYRLFDIGSFIGERDWFGGMWESNCLFAPRSLLEQVGAFDESFDEPGGGYTNLEIYERLGNSPDVTVCSMIGEGSFHQIHGGTTTNQPDAVPRQRRIDGYAEKYAEVRGRPFKGPGKPLHYVGRLPNVGARRTIPRRLSPRAFADGISDEGMPESPSPISEDLVAAFTEAAWHTLPWRSTSWLGHAIDTAPTDLMAYQEIINSVRPDVIIETGASVGGRSLFLASMCELVGHGHVVAIGGVGDDLPEHDRLRFVSGAATDPATVAEVEALVDGGRAVVVLGATADRDGTKAEFDRYQSLVPEGSFVIVADTIVNGHPVWPSFGPGPHEGVKQIVNATHDFVVDPTMEKYSLTFNPGGFLRRVAES